MKLSLRTIASRLRAQAYRIGRTTVGRLLRKLGFGLVANRKSLTGAVHPDRNRQFGYIRRVFLRAGYLSSVSIPRTRVGNFANQGRTWRQAPEQVNLHDFPGDALGRAVPYGIYDIVHNQGYVYLGNSYDTPEFAVHAIAQWWADPARPRFPREDKLLILCDAGGSNNCRSWLWKAELQRQCADRFGISVLVCHYPTGASSYNPIEYRLFSQITRNWAGKPLRSFATMRNYIRSTTTTTGLTVNAFLVDRAFQKGRKLSKEQRQTIQLTRRPICPLELYDCTNIDILNLNQTATLFADSYLVDNRVMRCLAHSKVPKYVTQLAFQRRAVGLRDDTLFVAKNLLDLARNFTRLIHKPQRRIHYRVIGVNQAPCLAGIALITFEIDRCHASLFR